MTHVPVLAGNHTRTALVRQDDGLLVDLCGVSKIYHTPAGDFPALLDVDLEIRSGEFVAIVGKSGSGKSTLINVITGIDRPTTGEVWIHGHPVHRLSEEQIALWRGHSIGVIFQFFQLLPTLTAIENVLLPMDYSRQLPPARREVRALDLLAQVGLAQQAHAFPRELSGGEQQRIAIARALANDPPIITADEPTGNLDSRAADAVMRLFEALVAGGKTVLMVTHDLDLARRCHRLVTLKDGRIVDEPFARRDA